MDNIENAHSAVKDRMFGILDSKYVTYHSNGSASALSKGHRIEIQANVNSSIFERKAGDLFIKNKMDNIQQLFQYTIDLLSKFSIKHESHSFPSGAIMWMFGTMTNSMSCNLRKILSVFQR